MKSTITISFEVAQSAYEDQDEPVPAVTDGSQSEVKVKPVPHPRSRMQSKSQRNNNNDDTVDYADTTSTTTSVVSSQLSEYPADNKTPLPFRSPPPRPPRSKCMISRNPTIDRGNHHMTAVSEPTNPAVNTERIQSPPAPRPERPPPPSISYSSRSTMRLKSESDSDESLQSSCPISFMPQSPVSPALSNEELNFCRTFSTMATDSPKRPAVPPRPGQSPLARFDSLGGTSSPQTRPPLPSFSPPPIPESEEPSDTVYSEAEHRPYLDVLPEDVDNMSLGKPTVGNQSGHYSPHQQTTEDAEDINGLLRWLKKLSKFDGMASSVYGLSIEEEIRSLSQRAMNVRKALRLYNLLMMKRKESLRDLITEFSSISNSLDKMKKKGKSMDIAGGTTGAIGGVTAVLGIAFAPATLGASLIATAIGVGMVASAGGISAHSATAKKKIVNRMTVEKLVYDYKGNVVDLEHCLVFILSGMNELQRHDIARLQRAGAQPDSLKMAHLSQFVFKNNTTKDRGASLTHVRGLSSERLLLAFAKEMDQYFTENDGQTLKKSSKSKFSGRVRLLAKNLQEELFHLNRMWEMFG
ncbi:uncharacterized protein LOC116400420 [Anarrhichthys ocellatus]|uniref:uncharacterized protein LOC116400420 n=1 Tax=Anarrhichthys ocellatus TaxID=433405 RepID=UPI0012EE1C1B|nr:uncharacterized protein LOC116400420 [Anarrhichthys ocellatus]